MKNNALDSTWEHGREATQGTTLERYIEYVIFLSRAEEDIHFPDLRTLWPKFGTSPAAFTGTRVFNVKPFTIYLHCDGSLEQFRHGT